MRAQLSNRDYEQLSAYIDGQLAPAERRKLEERLRARPELQTALDEMSRTRALLRAAPRRRAPRNFTLTEAMVGERRPRKRGIWWNVFPVLSFTSALATLALVASVLFQGVLTPAVTQAPVVHEPQAVAIDKIVHATMTVMMATASANKAAPAAPGQGRAASGAENATPAAAAQPTEPALAAPFAAQPTATQPSAPSGQARTLAGTPTAQLAEGTAQPESAQPMLGADQQSTAPIVTWGANNSQPGATGMGGGGGQGPSLGNILGPPPAPDTAAPAYGKGGGGGGGPDVQSGPIVLPTESLNSLPTPTNAPDATQQPEPTSEPTIGPAQPNPAISGTGPILGVPAPGQGGQIVDEKAILGQPAAQRDQSQPAAGSAPAVQNDSQPPQGGAQQPAQTPSQTLFGLPALLVIQGMLALLAIATGVGAFIVYRGAKK